MYLYKLISQPCTWFVFRHLEADVQSTCLLFRSDSLVFMIVYICPQGIFYMDRWFYQIVYYFLNSCIEGLGIWKLCEIHLCSMRCINIPFHQYDDNDIYFYLQRIGQQYWTSSQLCLWTVWILSSPAWVFYDLCQETTLVTFMWGSLIRLIPQLFIESPPMYNL